MNETTAGALPPGTSYAERRWQSDVIVDLIKRFGFPYIALNPGASYRGLHNSLVNYGGNHPPMLLCQHEKIAVQIAHGYAKATGKPMVAIVHDVVGLLHATMGIYYAYVDRAPVFVIGATGPMDESRRRPFIDWIHTANVQGEQVRNYVKWDYQPGSIEGVPEEASAAPTGRRRPSHRARSTCATTPGCRSSRFRPTSSCRPMATSRAPVPMAVHSSGGAGDGRRSPAGGEIPGAARRTCRPHPERLLRSCRARRNGRRRRLRRQRPAQLSQSPPIGEVSMDKNVFRDADLILSLDTRDWEKPTHVIDRTKRAHPGALSRRAAR